ncbi:NFX1-type zinc finger-containing protein 1 [Orbilia oligospora]|nr:NFX1-type zinc finger-containing protein 1 [Orbilia oligospora]
MNSRIPRYSGISTSFRKRHFGTSSTRKKNLGEIVLVSGPAGAGKTLTAASAIVAAMKQQPQRLPILVIAEKNIAVENIFTACIKILGQDTADFNILFLQSKFARLTLKERNRDIADLIRPFTMKSKTKGIGGKPEGTSWTDFKAKILNEQTIIFTTINFMYQTSTSWKNFSPKMLVLDDAAATTELNSLLAWLMFRQSIGRFVLIGDETQLKLCSISGNGQMLTSLFERLRISDWPTANLQMNHPQIFPGSQKNVIWSNVTGTELRMGQYTYHNERESVCCIVYELVTCGIKPNKIAALTGYSDQLYHLGKKLAYMKSQGLHVRSIDDYQGLEKEIVIVSFIRSNKSETIGFMGKKHRLCCAISRARFTKILVGNFDTMKQTVKKSKKGMTGFINADKIEVNELPGTSSIDISKIPTEISKEQSAEEENEDEDEDRDEDENEDKDQG